MVSISQTPNYLKPTKHAVMPEAMPCTTKHSAVGCTAQVEIVAGSVLKVAIWAVDNRTNASDHAEWFAVFNKIPAAIKSGP
jgi:hypothetical protein